MKKTRALALLMAAGMPFGFATTITLDVATAETRPADPTIPMADQYDPYINDLTFNKAQQDSGSTRIRQPIALPSGTTLHLMDANVTDTLRSHNGVLFSLNEGRDYPTRFPYYYLQAQQSIDKKYTDSGNTTTARVLFQYPDGSQDIAEATLTIIPTIAQVKGATYPRTTMTSGDTTVIAPSLNTPRATGTQFALIQSPETDALRQNGWEISMAPGTGEVTVTSPEQYAIAQIPVLAKYPDGTSQTVKIDISSAPYVETPDIIPMPSDNDRSFGSSSS